MKLEDGRCRQAFTTERNDVPLSSITPRRTTYVAGDGMPVSHDRDRTRMLNIVCLYKFDRSSLRGPGKNYRSLQVYSQTFYFEPGVLLDRVF